MPLLANYDTYLYIDLYNDGSYVRYGWEYF